MQAPTPLASESENCGFPLSRRLSVPFHALSASGHKQSSTRGRYGNSTLKSGSVLKRYLGRHLRYWKPQLLAAPALPTTHVSTRRPGKAARGRLALVSQAAGVLPRGQVVTVEGHRSLLWSRSALVWALACVGPAAFCCAERSFASRGLQGLSDVRRRGPGAVRVNRQSSAPLQRARQSPPRLRSGRCASSAAHDPSWRNPSPSGSRPR